MTAEAFLDAGGGDYRMASAKSSMSGMESQPASMLSSLGTVRLSRQLCRRARPGRRYSAERRGELLGDGGVGRKDVVTMSGRRRIETLVALGTLPDATPANERVNPD